MMGEIELFTKSKPAYLKKNKHFHFKWEIGFEIMILIDMN